MDRWAVGVVARIIMANRPSGYHASFWCDRVMYKAIKTIEPLDGVWIKLLDSRTATLLVQYFSGEP